MVISSSDLKHCIICNRLRELETYTAVSRAKSVFILHVFTTSVSCLDRTVVREDTMYVFMEKY